MFIVSLNYIAPLEEVDKHLDAHVAFLREQYGKMNLVASGRKLPRTGGIMLSRIQDREELEAMLAKDPFQIAGVAAYDIVEFVPSMTAEGFENLKEQ
jgi:uncharacterized protein YciI